MKFRDLFEMDDRPAPPKRMEILKNRIERAERAIEYHEGSEKGDDKKLKKHQNIWKKATVEYAKLREKHRP